MSLRPSFRSACRVLALRTRPLPPRQDPVAWAATKRGYAADEFSQQIPLLRRYDPAAANAESQSRAGETPRSDEAAVDAEEAAEVRRELAKAAAADGDALGLEGGLTESQLDTLYREGSIPPTRSTGDPVRDLEIIASGGVIENPEDDAQPTMPDVPPFKFPRPTLPLPPHSHLKSRYHPVLDQMTNLLMRDGKKSQAQRNMAMVLNFLRTSPPPIINPRFPLLPGAPPPAHLPLNPVLYLTLAVDSVAPLITIRRIPGGAGGGRPLERPSPLSVRQRRWAAFNWIMDVVNKKPSKGSGRTQLAHRIADEIIAVVEGRSQAWEKRLAVHKLGTATRANLTVKPVKNKSKK